MSDYPVPRYAASAWIAGDQLWLAFPALSQGDRGHSVPFKIDLALLRNIATTPGETGRAVRGVLLALETLAARNAQSAVGTRGSPIRYDVENALANDAKFKEWLGAMSAQKAATAVEREEAEAFLRECGL